MFKKKKCGYCGIAKESTNTNTNTNTNINTNTNTNPNTNPNTHGINNTNLSILRQILQNKPNTKNV